MLLPIKKHRFILESVDKIILPPYKGSTFHGGFGHALMEISPLWYRYFFEPETNKKGDLPKPFVILPPMDKLECYPKKYQFKLDISLFGEASQHYSIVQAAIEYLGMQMGLGFGQGQYKVIDILKSKPDLFNFQTVQQITLHFPTPLRLKENNQLCRQAPEFNLIIKRLLGRLRTLEKSYSGLGLDSDYQHYLIEKSKNIFIKNSNIQWNDWNRFSGRQKLWMKFGGLTGNISYSGDLQPFMKILSLGEWLHIGGKTSFGLGKYKLSIDDQAL